MHMDDRPEVPLPDAEEVASNPASEPADTAGLPPTGILGGLLMGDLPPLGGGGLNFTSWINKPLPPPIHSTAKLAAFARKRGMPVGGPGWQGAVLYQAASEHKELIETRRGRGRPKIKTTGYGLFSVEHLPSELEADKVLRTVERLQEAAVLLWGKKITAKDACRRYVEAIDGLDPNNPAHAERFESKVGVRQNQVSQARKRRAEQAR